jgi:hypothetical protein
MPLYNIRLMLLRAEKLGLIHTEKKWSIILEPAQLELLRQIEALIERIRHGLSARRMMYDHAEICTMPLEEQARLDDNRELFLSFNKVQRKGLKQLALAESELPINSQKASINNPNILVNCDSGTDGELGCKLGYIKVYQACYAASYGENGWKDVFVHNVRGREQIVIQPATGGKCNVSIGNPFRIAGWYLNYVNQGSTAALIRMWEIPSEYFVKTMLRYCGTEKQIKDSKNKDVYFVEMCDHKATNQFGIWTHKEVYGTLTPTVRGKEFADKGRNLITYCDPSGTHRPCKRDGEVRDVHDLFKHLGIATFLTDRFHDFGMSVSDAQGNLTMNDDVLQRDMHMLRIIELLQDLKSDASSKIATLDRESVRLFTNLLSYNNLSPEKWNEGKRFTATGLSFENLRHETQFMAQVYTNPPALGLLQKVVQAIHDRIVKDDELKDENLKALPGLFYGKKTYKTVIAFARALLGDPRNNKHAIDALNVALRPLCAGDGTPLGVTKISTKNQNFNIQILSDLPFEIGKSHRADLARYVRLADPLSNRERGGFVPVKGFRRKLDSGVKTSNSSVQLNLHEQVVARLRDLGVPMLGGISGTTRDIFAMINPLITSNGEYWSFFAIVAAFMIKHHYHTLVECFIAANQVRPISRSPLAYSTVSAFYREIAYWTGVNFYP